MSMPPPYGSAPAGPPPVCPRHPDLVSYVSCQRCGRPACPACQRPAAVGVQCVDCVAQAHRGTRQAVTVSGAAWRSHAPVATYVVIALCLFGYALQRLIPGFSESFLAWNVLTREQPWRLLTAGFLHDTSTVLPMHLALNMLSFWFLGRALEPVLGHWRLASVFLVGVVGGSAAQVILTSPFSSGWGASGGVFALGGALLVQLRHDRAQLTSLAVVLGINLVYGFTLGSGISWQAHVGGLVTGVILGFLYAAGARLSSRATLHVVGTLVLAALLVATGMALDDIDVPVRFGLG